MKTVEFKYRNKNYDENSMIAQMIGIYPEFRKHLSTVRQVVINEKSVLLKGARGRYIANLSLTEIEKNFDRVLEAA